MQPISHSQLSCKTEIRKWYTGGIKGLSRESIWHPQKALPSRNMKLFAMTICLYNDFLCQQWIWAIFNCSEIFLQCNGFVQWIIAIWCVYITVPYIVITRNKYVIWAPCRLKPFETRLLTKQPCQAKKNVLQPMSETANAILLIF